MAFPSTGLPDRIVVHRRSVTGMDDDDNAVYGWHDLIQPRPTRFYRDVPRTVPLVREGLTVQAMVAFKFLPGDPGFDYKDEVTLTGPEFPTDGTRFVVVWVYPKMLWRSQSHWEIAIGTAGDVFRSNDG